MSAPGETRVQAKLADDIAELKARLKEVTRKTPKLEREYNKLWDAYAKGAPVEAEAQAASRAYNGAIDTQRFIAGQIAKLSSPQELERRLSINTKLEGVRKMAKAKTPTPCECGCGGESKGRFLPGHDARLKSRLISEALAGSEGAANQLTKLKWGAFLAKSRKVAQAKAAKAAEVAQRKADREAERAAKAAEKKAKQEEAKAAKKAEADAAKATKAAKAGDVVDREAKPDPKPTRRRRTTKKEEVAVAS